MRKLIAISLLLLVQIATVVAQDTTYYKGSEKVTKKDNYDWFEFTIKDNSDSTISIGYAFYKTGNAMHEIGQKTVVDNLYQRSYKTLHGRCKYWYENGKVQHESTYKNGIMVGKLLTYYENGTKKREDEYNEKGEKITGHCYDEKGIEIKWFEYEIPAEYPGGMSEFQKFLSQNIQYPINARNNRIEGKVIVSFIIDKDGTPIEFKIVKGISPELDEEALRVLKLMPKWIQALKDGNPVKARMSVPVKFKIG